MSVPQPIPYQGSKRRLAPIIRRYLPTGTRALYEPFVGSGAVTIAAAAAGQAERFIVGDSLGPLVAIWKSMLRDPGALCDGYESLWRAQLVDPRGFYDVVRERFNREAEPAQLLYLMARCVKNAVRFNRQGAFNQSPDKRRLGVRPEVLRRRVEAVYGLLAGRARAVHRDYAESLLDAEPADVVYLDPPYLGVSGGRDARYHQGLDYARFVAELGAANARRVSFLVSFDGRLGGKRYGPALPRELQLHCVEIHAGRSSQATLSGRTDETVESLYLSPALVARLCAEGVRPAVSERVAGGSA